MGVDRAACVIRELIFIYLSDGNFKCQRNGIFFNILVIAKVVIQNCHLYSAFLICSVPQRCCPADLSNDLPKIDFTRVALFRWEGCGRTGGSAVLLAAALTSVSQSLPRAHVPGAAGLPWGV